MKLTSTRVKCVKPAIFKIDFSTIAKGSAPSGAEHWGWNRLADVVDCLREATGEMGMTPTSFVNDFGIFNACSSGQTIVTLVGVTKDEPGWDFQWDNSPAHVILLDGFDYYIPAGWGNLVTDPWVNRDKQGIVRAEPSFFEDGRLLRIDMIGQGGEAEFWLPSGYCFDVG